MRLIARAKVNLFLRVVGPRPDGYHEVETIMQAVDLFDEVTLRPSGENRISIRWREGLEGGLPMPPDLTQKAIEVFAREVPAAPPVEATVTKAIPIGAGLGGGSADAAATMLGLSHLVGGLPARELMEMAAGVGSDVPFALQGATAIARGRGEKVSAVPAPDFWWVLGVPGVRLQTAEVYRKHSELGGEPGPEVADMVKALKYSGAQEVAELLHNDLEAAALELEPSIAALKASLVAAGPLGAVMTGSGSAMAGLCRDETHARKVAQAIQGDFDIEVVHGAMRGAELVGG